MPESKRPKQPATLQLEPGTLLLDRYSIVKRVGGGGMGSVYQARDKRLADRLCAVKEVIEMFADQVQRAKAVEDFKREAEVLAQLDHPSIPTVFDYFIEAGRYYLVMRWIGGGDLADQMRLRAGFIEEPIITKWAIQICDVLHYMHQQRPPIIYRDLKPANLMLDDKTNRVMLVDFGIARIVRATEKGVTADGTMGYAPPELFAGKVEPRSDIYSLGATMFHMLTGSDPQDNPLLIFDFSKNPRPCQINPAITPEMERILMKSVAHKPEDRHSSALEFMRALEEHSGRLESTPAGGGAYPPIDAAPREPRSSSSSSAAAGGSAQASGTAIEWVFCGHCGEKIGGDEVYCAHCGQRQPMAGAAVAGYAGAAGGGYAGAGFAGRITAQLLIVGTNDMVKPFTIDKESVLIGRTDPYTGIFPEIDLTMYDPENKVSRKHARIYRQGEQFLIEDLGSVTGTVVNSITGGSVRLKAKEPRVLTAGDELKLGGTILQFEPPLYVDNNVQFTVFQPKVVRPLEWYPLLAFAHLSERRPDAKENEPDPIQEANNQARKRLGDQITSYKNSTQDSTQAVPREGELTFLPNIPGVEFNPNSRSFFWMKTVHCEDFDMRASPSVDGRTVKGRLTVFLGSILIAEVNLSIRVDSRHLRESHIGDAIARPYRKIFASYSHRDRDIVEQFEHYARAIGDQYLRDLTHLRAGEVWNDQLEQMIVEADIFQLFWSSNAMVSSFVKREWECALKLRRPNFIRPTYWEEPLPSSPDKSLPPEELLRLHFQRIHKVAASSSSVFARERTTMPADNWPPALRTEVESPSPEPQALVCIVCSDCGASNEPGWSFCQQCGKRLTQPASAPPTVVADRLGVEPIDSEPDASEVPIVETLAPAPPQAPAQIPPPSIAKPSIPVPPSTPPAPAAEQTTAHGQSQSGALCNQCGQSNSVGSAFCASCGGPITTGETMVMSSRAAPPPTGRLHLIMEGEQPGEVYDLAIDTVIGRNKGEITFPHDGFMSGRHARIERRGCSFILTDEGSRNGTFIKIKGEVELQPGDMILVGRQLFRFEV